MKLTDKKCKNLKPKDKTYKVADGSGLCLVVDHTGSKYWRFNYRFNKKQKTLALGVYPEVSLAQARQKLQDARQLLSANIDPNANKKKQKILTAQKSENIFKNISLCWYENKKDVWSDKHRTTILERLKTDVFPLIGSMHIDEITPSLVMSVLKKLEERNALETAKKVLGICNQIFQYAVINEFVKVNPCYGLRATIKKYNKRHFSAITPAEIPEFLRAIETNKPKLKRQTILAMRLLMLTFVRTSELIGAEWSEFDLDKVVWVIPASKMKMKRDHIVPLSKQSVEILTELKAMYKTSYVFPSMQGHAATMSNNTILNAIWSLGYKGKMTGHGFRSLAMTTILEELNGRYEVADRQLAHAPKSEIDAAYNRSIYLQERTVMMQNWADYLDRVSGKINNINNVFMFSPSL